MRVLLPGRAGGAIVWVAMAVTGVLFDASSPLAEGFNWTTYLDPNKPVDAVVHDGAVWLASTRGAVTVYDISDSSFTTVHRRPGRLASNNVLRIISDDSGKLWFGTAASGVSVLDPSTSQWDLLTRFEGLPSDNVLAIASWGDSIWIGTPDGFAVFSGGGLAGRCNVFVPPESRCPLESFWIQAIAPLGDGAYLGTAAGVSWFDGEEETPLGRPWLLGTVKDLVVFEGEPWVLTSLGVYSWDSSSSQWLEKNEGLSFVGSFRRLTMIDGTAYVAGQLGIYRRDESTWARVGSRFDAIAVAGFSEEGFWAAGPIGLYHLSGDEWIRIPAPGPPINDARSVAIGQGGEAWITGSYWSTRFDGEMWEPVSAGTTQDRLQGCDTHGLFVDSQNRIWWGHCCREGVPDSCMTDRLNRSDGSWRWRRFNASNIWRVAEGGGSIWLAGRYTGLYEVEQGDSEPKPIREGPGMPASDLLSSLAFEPGRGLWIGHRQQGVDLFRGAASGGASGWEHIDTGMGLVSNSVRKVLLKGNQLWVGTLNGVSVIDGATLTVIRNYTVGPGGIEDRITNVSGLAVDGVGDVWVTTSGGGVYLISDDGSIESFTERNSPLTDDRAKDVAYDPFNEVIWITTSAGINRISRLTSPAEEAGVSLYVYPNPFCPDGCDGEEGGALFIGGLPGAADGEVVDVTGRIMSRFFDARNGDPIWDGTDASGSPAGSGLYFVLVRTGSGSDRAAVALVR
jgi:ligand-binding sensor domain-containing protein